MSSICLDWLLTQESNYQGAMAWHETVISLFILYTFFSTILPVISSQSYKLNTFQQRGVFYCLYSTCSLGFFSKFGFQIGSFALFEVLLFVSRCVYVQSPTEVLLRIRISFQLYVACPITLDTFLHHNFTNSFCCWAFGSLELWIVLNYLG